MVHLLASTLALVSCIGPTADPLAADPLATSDAWSEGHAAHLLRRAGFGGTPDQIKFIAGLGRRQAVDILVDFERFSESPLPLTLAPHRPPLRFTHPDLDENTRTLLIRPAPAIHTMDMPDFSGSIGVAA